LDDEGLLLLSLFSFSFLIKKFIFQFCDINKDFQKKKSPKKLANLGFGVSHEKTKNFPILGLKIKDKNLCWKKNTSLVCD
jgi:hypothetical protein